MLNHDQSDTDHLLARAGAGDRSALGRLLERHRNRLKQLVVKRMDQRIAARIDPSDIVQETLTDAQRRLPEYLDQRRTGFFGWLYGLTRQRLVWARRLHLVSSKRSTSREYPREPFGSESLIGSDTSPSGRVIAAEDQTKMQQAIKLLSAIDQEILKLRYHDSLAFTEIADRLKMKQSTVKMRHLRAIERIRSEIDTRESKTAV